VTRVVFHPDALQELRDQALFYEERSAGLGERFVVQVEGAITLAASMPGIGSAWLHGTRRVFPRDFPHSVVYRVMPDFLVILAVAPFRRKPGYWRERH
jgi:plasmid stabilization system protein ParE